jgi:hypothetical protein
LHLLGNGPVFRRGRRASADAEIAEHVTNLLPVTFASVICAIAGADAVASASAIIETIQVPFMSDPLFVVPRAWSRKRA